MGHWLVIDLEATTEEGGWPIEQMEIIEIGASMVNAQGHEVDHFQRFVKPVRRPHLTRFCRDLTHINQSDVDNAVPLAEIWPHFERWLSQHHPRLVGWASWGEYDRRQLEQDWRLQKLTSHLSNVSHLNLKKTFAQARKLQQPVGLHTALQLSGISFSGQQHRALCDARNTARLLPLVLPIQS
ncbi:exonuclease domain-containing protein [Pseudomonas sp. EL_65y_Pfl2_R95]|uniref:exonuclease domain-containing protein n=1 Tax=Pseudomonas sp. EL_65y_Pfl2_R95 TaxID=3088698 RepID=UPI0030D9470E